MMSLRSLAVLVMLLTLAWWMRYRARRVYSSEWTLDAFEQRVRWIGAGSSALVYCIVLVIGRTTPRPWAREHALVFALVSAPAVFLCLGFTMLPWFSRLVARRVAAFTAPPRGNV
jgi:hypothetical protein